MRLKMVAISFRRSKVIQSMNINTHKVYFPPFLTCLLICISSLVLRMSRRIYTRKGISKVQSDVREHRRERGAVMKTHQIGELVRFQFHCVAGNQQSSAI